LGFDDFPAALNVSPILAIGGKIGEENERFT
jgi:hypothetical protein